MMVQNEKECSPLQHVSCIVLVVAAVVGILVLAACAPRSYDPREPTATVQTPPTETPLATIARTPAETPMATATATPARRSTDSPSPGPRGVLRASKTPTLREWLDRNGGAACALVVDQRQGLPPSLCAGLILAYEERWR